MRSALPHEAPASARFSQLLSSTRRGARLARLLAAETLRCWDVPPSVLERAEHVVAELAGNAVLHGQARGRDFRLVLTLDTPAGVLHIEVTDATGDRLPTGRPTTSPSQAESGRGLLLVTAFADRWGTRPFPPSGKTVWAELHTGAGGSGIGGPGVGGAG